MTDSFSSICYEVLAASCLWLRGWMDRYHRTNHHPRLFLRSGAEQPGLVISADTVPWRGSALVTTSTSTISFQVAVSSPPWLFSTTGINQSALRICFICKG